MKQHSLLSLCTYLFISSFFMIPGCSRPVLKMPQPLPSIIKDYRHVDLYAGNAGMQNTKIHVTRGDTYSILAMGSIDFCPRGTCPNHDVRPEQGWPLMARIGDRNYFYPLFFTYNARTTTAYDSGCLYVGYKKGKVDDHGEPSEPNLYKHDAGFFSLDIIIWEQADFVQISEFFTKMKKKDPGNKAIADALSGAEWFKNIYLTKAKTSKEIEETKRQLEGLKGESGREKEPATAPTAEAEHQERVAQLETKLAKLMTTVAQMEEMKKRLEQVSEETSLLSKELEEKEKREKDLLTKLEEGSKTPPVIAIASPEDGSKIEGNSILLSGVAEDDQGIERLEIFINNQPAEKKIGRGITVTGERFPRRLEFAERIRLEKGENKVLMRAVDSDGLSSEKLLTVHKLEIQKKIWAAVIGINNYQSVRKLRYAVDDAKAFYDHLVHYNHIPVENVTLLLDQQASLTRLRSTLGTDLKGKAGRDDMVIIFFAGHGATEKDVMSPDGDGLEKYLLPYDADPKDLYATALPMGEISRIFNRIQSERLVFIADSCYSGASGGRTITVTGIRANISDAFLDRIAGGKGRIILSASGANEVSSEDEKLRHGVFTYFLLEGLQGKADTDKDGVITVDEAYAYVSKHVPQATRQEQHPVKKGILEGHLILGVID